MQWFKDDTEVQTDDKYKCTFFENIALLEISNLTSKDSGNCTCIAKNKAGSVQCSGLLFVKGLSTSLLVFVRYHLCVSAYGALLVSRSSAFDLFFSLAEPPCILEKPESMNVLPGSKVYFSVLIAGTPPLTIKWFKNKKEILSSTDCLVTKDNTSTSLALFFAKSSDSAEYVCEIQNDVGSASCEATLFVKGWLYNHFIQQLLHFPTSLSVLNDFEIVS